MSRAELLERRRRQRKEELETKFGASTGRSPPPPEPGQLRSADVAVSPTDSSNSGFGQRQLSSSVTARAVTVPPDGVPEVAVQNFSCGGTELARMPPLGIGVHHDQGMRRDMEDAHALHAQLPGAPTGTSLFVVCDGHAGKHVADMVAEMLPAEVASRVSTGGDGSDPAALLASSFVAVDRDIFRRVGSADGGAAAVAALMLGTDLWVAHIGDCRAVVSEAGKAVPLTRDHRAVDPQEKKRVEAGGAFVAFGRVCASLMVTRTFGDFGFKGMDSLLTGPAKPVSNIPEVATFRLSQNTEFILLACDGVFDVLTNDEAIQVCRSVMHEGAQKMAQEVVRTALKKGTMDNVTALIISLTR